MNKNTKIWLNYTLGAIISALLLWGIYLQVKAQFAKIDTAALVHTGPSYFLWMCVLMMPINQLLEAKKWHILARSAQPVSFGQALASYLAGIAFSIVTPNRLGEYPGRIVYLRRKNTFRLISVSVLGAMAQMFALFTFGLIGLIYFNVHFPSRLAAISLVICIVTTLFIVVFYWWFENWLPALQKVRWLRKFNLYSQLIKRFTTKEQLTVLGISLFRFGFFTAQYLFLLRWMNVDMPLADGYCMAALFFWTIAIIPSIALAELGERGYVSLYLFHYFSQNTVGILTATAGIWCLNLIIPSVVGSILLFRMKVIK